MCGCLLLNPSQLWVLFLSLILLKLSISKLDPFSFRNKSRTQAFLSCSSLARWSCHTIFLDFLGVSSLPSWHLTAHPQGSSQNNAFKIKRGPSTPSADVLCLPVSPRKESHRGQCCQGYLASRAEPGSYSLTPLAPLHPLWPFHLPRGTDILFLQKAGGSATPHPQSVSEASMEQSPDVTPVSTMGFTLPGRVSATCQDPA